MKKWILASNAISINPLNWKLDDSYAPASLHNEDYTFFYNNIKDNVAKRIATYQANM